MLILASLAGIVTLVCWIVVLIAAFSEDTTQGILSLCVPFYIFYYVIARYQGDYKLWIAAGLIGGWTVSTILRVVDFAISVSDAAVYS